MAVSSPDLTEQIICSAIQMPDGYLIRGHRHSHCFLAAKDMERYKDVKWTMEMHILISGVRILISEDIY